MRLASQHGFRRELEGTGAVLAAVDAWRSAA